MKNPAPCGSRHLSFFIFIVGAALASMGGWADGADAATPVVAKNAEFDVSTQPPVKIGGIVLPPQVPYLNPPKRYVIGSGIAMAVGDVAGDWTEAAGPGYTNHNLIAREDLALEIDGTDVPLVLEMKRASRTGLYYGITTRGDLRIGLVDFARWGQPSVSRLVVIENHSATNAHHVRVRATITPRQTQGISANLVGTAPDAVAIQGSDAVPDTFFSGRHDPITAAVAISFADAGTQASHSGSTYTLETSDLNVAPGKSVHTLLGHHFHFIGASDADAASLAAIRAQDGPGDLAKTIAAWQGWFAKVGPKFRLENIPDKRARLLVEGGLALIKTNESADGGFAAQLTLYSQGFIRDSVLACRALSATGHFDELRRWLVWEARKFDLYGHIADASTCMPSLNDTSVESVEGGNGGVEGTALCLLCARDYLAGTHDLAALKSVDKLLRFCMEVQLQQAVANGEKLEFDSDETEICSAIDVMPSGSQEGGAATRSDWSLSSVALCAASLDFYIQYLKDCGVNPRAYHSTLTGATLDLPAEQARLVAAMDRDFWRTDVPGLSAGFHDAFRLKANGGWPAYRIVNFTLMPVYFGTPYPRAEQEKDIAAMDSYFDPKTGFLQLVPGANTGFDGHDLGYLLWDLVETGGANKDQVYHALVDGPTVDSWGSFDEGYSATGVPNGHDLRSLETGVNVSAIAKYWGLGGAAAPKRKF